MSALPHEPLTQAEFPAWESRQAVKHEFVDGHVYSFAGGTLARQTIAAELLAAILPAARPCLTLGSDMLIEMSHSTRYADVVVTSDERDLDPIARVIRYPKLIVEVLSESTASIDLGAKVREYQAITELEEYVLVDARKRWVQTVRRSNADWVLATPIATGTIDLEAVDVAIDLDGLYDRARVPA